MNYTFESTMPYFKIFPWFLKLLECISKLPKGLGTH